MMRCVYIHTFLKGGLLGLDNGMLFIFFLMVTLSNLQDKDQNLYIFAFPASIHRSCSMCSC